MFLLQYEIFIPSYPIDIKMDKYWWIKSFDAIEEITPEQYYKYNENGKHIIAHSYGSKNIILSIGDNVIHTNINALKNLITKLV